MIKCYCTNLPTPELLSCSLSHTSLLVLFTLILSLPHIFCFPFTENFDYKIIVTLECRLYAPNHPLFQLQQTNKSETALPFHTTDNNRPHFCTSLWVITFFFFFPATREQASCYSMRCPDLKLDRRSRSLFASMVFKL